MSFLLRLVQRVQKDLSDLLHQRWPDRARLTQACLFCLEFPFRSV